MSVSTFQSQLGRKVLTGVWKVTLLTRCRTFRVSWTWCVTCKKVVQLLQGMLLYYKLQRLHSDVTILIWRDSLTHHTNNVLVDLDFAFVVCSIIDTQSCIHYLLRALKQLIFIWRRKDWWVSDGKIWKNNKALSRQLCKTRSFYEVQFKINVI